MTDEPTQAQPVAEEGVQAEFSQEEWRLRPDGTIYLKLDGKPYVIRRPNFGELRKLRETLKVLATEETKQFAPLNERFEVLAAPLRARLAEAEGVPAEERDLVAVIGIRAEIEVLGNTDDMRQLRTEMDEAREASTLALLGWWHETLLPMLAHPTPAMGTEELPGWMASQETMIQAMDHFTYVPQRPGAA